AFREVSAESLTRCNPSAILNSLLIVPLALVCADIMARLPVPGLNLTRTSSGTYFGPFPRSTRLKTLALLRPVECPAGSNARKAVTSTNGTRSKGRCLRQGVIAHPGREVRRQSACLPARDSGCLAGRRSRPCPSTRNLQPDCRSCSRLNRPLAHRPPSAASDEPTRVHSR